MAYRHNRGCPECGTGLGIFRTGDYSYETCQGCCGMWIPLGVLRAMISEMNPHAGDALDYAAHPQRSCPDCRAPMTAMTLHSVPVDVCREKQHGVWFDRDELRQVLEAVGTGEPAQLARRGEFQSLLHDFFAKQR